MRRKLPLFVERSLQQVQADRLELADQFQRTVAGEQSISCTAGCAACCYHPVLVTIMEAIPLYGSLVEHGRWTPSFKEKLGKASQMTSGLSPDVWLLAKIPCPLLDDKKRCSAYEARPFLCRVTIATGDPFYCDAHHLGKQTTIVPHSEAVVEFHAREKATLRKHGLLHLLMPIGRAVLMAERVCSGTLTLESVDRTYMIDHLADEA